MLDAYGVTEENWRDGTVKEPHFAISETPAFVGRAVAALAADPDRARWNGRSTSSGELAQVYGFTDLDGSRPDAWRYLVEVQDPGKPADVTGYRSRSPPPGEAPPRDKLQSAKNAKNAKAQNGETGYRIPTAWFGETGTSRGFFRNPSLSGLLPL